MLLESKTSIVNFLASTSELVEAFKESAFIIAVIIVGAFLLHRFGINLFKRGIRRMIEGSPSETAEAERQREDTLIQIGSGVLAVIVWPIAILMALSELGFDIAPLLAGAGVVGFAFGFGAQNLVKDVIAGLFIITENQYRVGDVVELCGKTGKVEKISLRKTTLRDLDGVVHHIPNGHIDTASNHSMEFSGVNFNVGVGYESDLNKVQEIIDITGSELAEDEKWQHHIIEAPAFLRVDNFADSAIEVKITGKVMPLQQWAVSGEMRKRLKTAFEKEGISLPFPQRVVHRAELEEN